MTTRLVVPRSALGDANDATSDSLIRRLLDIGTMIRRLDNFVASLRVRNPSPTLHALAHSLSMILAHVKKLLTKNRQVSVSHISHFWLQYSDTEELLHALADMCYSVCAGMTAQMSCLMMYTGSATLAALPSLSLFASGSSIPHLRHCLAPHHQSLC